MDRVIRRVTRTPPVAPASPATKVNAKQKALDTINDGLRSIAKLNRQAVEIATQLAAQEKAIEEAMRTAGITVHTDGVLEAALVDTFSNEKKEVDPKTLFNHKGFPRESFFKVVKVQIGELAKFMADNEIRAIAKIETSKKTGTALKIKPVKAVIGTAPKRRK